MDPGTPSHRLSQWKSRLCYAYILSIDTMSVQTITGIRLIIAEARYDNRKSIIVAFIKDYALNCLYVVVLPQLYFNQIQSMLGHIANTVLAVAYQAIMGPKFNHHTLQNQLDWKDWLAAELIQLDNYAKQNMFGTPCTAPIDASVFFWAWLYSIKPHKNDRKKVRGVCDGSTHGGKTMVHGATYAPICHNRLISAFKSLCQHLWVCTSGTLMSPMHSPTQVVPSRYITCAAIASS
jgi:hypothetical protein